MILRVLRRFFDAFNKDVNLDKGTIIEVKDWVRAERLLSNGICENYEGEAHPLLTLSIPDAHKAIRNKFKDSLSEWMVPITGYDYPFSISRYLLTQEEYAAIMAIPLEKVGSSPCGANLPFLTKRHVFWKDPYRGGIIRGCQQDIDWLKEFLNTLNRLTDHTFRLPTINEWEYVASNGGKEYDFKEFDPHIHEVGKGDANELGIYNMLEDPFELCNVFPSGAYVGKVGPNNQYDVLRSYTSKNEVQFQVSVRLVESSVHLCNINECHPDLEEEIIDAVEFYYDDYSDLRDNWEN